MNELRAIAWADVPSVLRKTWWGRGAANFLSRSTGYLRGLTLLRIGFVLLICVIFTARQQSLCWFQTKCGAPDMGTLAGGVHFLARQFLFSMPMLLAVTIADNATTQARDWLRIVWLAGAVLFGSVVYSVAFLYTQPANILNAAEGRHWLFLLTYASRAVLYGGLATAVLYLFARERNDTRALHTARLEKLALDRQMIEARLRALEAQIEPHFLFNTFANIRMLYETDVSRAKTLVHNLVAYLRIALPQMRDIRSTLGRELELARAYLSVLSVRMGERLTVKIDVPPHLRDASMPPMMLLTLVENAIKHGLSPVPQGGTITIRAERLGAGLRVAVIDDGIGFPKGFGGGIGLSNTRARLTALYGSDGRLSLEANAQGGVVAGIEFPFEIPATARAAA